MSAPSQSSSCGSVPDRRSALPVLGAGAARADELAGAGWTRRFIAAPPRLDEMVALYRSLGLEVRQEPVAAEAFDADCGDCLANGAGARIIFTREPT